MRNIGAFLILFQCSCISKTPAARQAEDFSRSSVAAVSDIMKITTDSTITSKLYQREMIGMWSAPDNEPISIEIREDSIYYSEHFESFKYILRGDSIFIKYPDHTFSAKVGVFKDTLIFYSDEGPTKFVRLLP